ncbi:GNAT family N-acetyltransferase [Pseudaestuariivita rosea]|uniref:GNAT family N-acetyltransferase n=1 Tax=Pseudaestuariivita rosea TaxID=2763263 RepID=UPI001ABA951A|nr:GNAT family N-acetyltransferase [Pseudaestuariivita rosea]
MTQFTVRVATRADIPQVDLLLSRSYPKLLKNDYPPSVLVTALPVISRARPSLLASGTYYVAETDGGLIVGAGGWTASRSAPVADIRHVVTDHRHVRQGIGRQLMQHIFDISKTSGVAVLNCMSTRTAVPFYASQGFVTLGPIDVKLRGGMIFPAVQMQKTL